ncbi:hypothetical protein H6F77_06560 [Microcoleus sp. FACHB-831]|uniref:hypothetical protein n=1 Tax=Microcoleus sp. FACHB-831 TaxID=2692827 RepID=UPI001683EC8D|nr:hypothetical protein [Microcoleus sp. FACHB-831]MBD1920745.1 hypothetical protein [Microcoleus sp. FACHB-831]
MNQARRDRLNFCWALLKSHVFGTIKSASELSKSLAIQQRPQPNARCDFPVAPLTPQLLPMWKLVR